MRPQDMTRRSPGRSRSRMPVVILSLAATYLVFRYAFAGNSSTSSTDSTGTRSALHVPNAVEEPFKAVEYHAAYYGEAAADSLRGMGSKARSLAEALVLRGQRDRKQKQKQHEQIVWQNPVHEEDDEYSTDGGSGTKRKKAEEDEDDKDPFGYAKAGISHHFDEEDRAPTGLKLSELVEKETLMAEPVRLCKECRCDVPGAYASSQQFSLAVPTVEKLRTVIKKTRSFHEPALLRYLLHSILLQETLEGHFMNDEAASELLTNHYTCPDALIAFNFEGLALDRPTSYIYTRTGPGGKLAKWLDRGKYLTRQAKTINQHLDHVSRLGYHDGAKGDDRQLVWLLVEDNSQMEPKLELMLRESGIPFVYFAHGPTNKFGKAQWNIVLRAVEVLRDGFFGDGPVYNLDDDSRILPELLSKMWKVSKAIVWQVGNYPCNTFNSWWEGPVFEKGKLVRWHYAWMPDRVFPIDLNGFAINSSQIGPNLPIAPPKYIPFDSKAGETEFLEKIYQSREDIEPLCEDTKAEKCYLTWHNSWLTPGWKDRPVDK